MVYINNVFGTFFTFEFMDYHSCYGSKDSFKRKIHANTKANKQKNYVKKLRHLLISLLSLKSIES